MTDHRFPEIDEIARKSPVALAMALERAISSHNNRLECAVLAALGELGIAVVNRAALANTLLNARCAARRHKRLGRALRSRRNSNRPTNKGLIDGSPSDGEAGTR